MGLLLVLILVIIWFYWIGDIIWGIVLLVWSVVVGILDNVICLVFICMGVDLLLFLIFFGVIGGLIVFGMIGLFIGLVFLVVIWCLFFVWVYEVLVLMNELEEIFEELDDIEEVNK